MYFNISVTESDDIINDGYEKVGNFYYKLHKRGNWTEAEQTCNKEWAQVFYPVDQKELESILPIWNKIPIYIGINSHTDFTKFKTIDGR